MSAVVSPLRHELWGRRKDETVAWGHIPRFSFVHGLGPHDGPLTRQMIIRRGRLALGIVERSKRPIKQISNINKPRNIKSQSNNSALSSSLLRIIQEDEEESDIPPAATPAASATVLEKHRRAPRMKRFTKTSKTKANILYTPSEARIKTSLWYTRLQAGESFSSSSLQKLYLEWLFNIWSFKNLEDWYQVTRQRILEAPFGFQFLNSVSMASLNDLFKNLWPNHDWIPWKWPSVRQDVWTPLAQREYFLSKVKDENLDSLYDLTRQEVDREAGTTLLQQYANYPAPLQAALRECFTEHQWLSWRFHPLPSGYWDSREHQRAYLEFFIASLPGKPRKTHFSVWHSLSPADIASDAAGASLIRYFGGSLIKALQSAFPEHEWCEWHFATVPTGFWTQLSNRRRFLDWFARNGLNESERFDPTDENSLQAWYKVKTVDIRRCGGRGLLAQTNYSLYKALSEAYPEFKFDPKKFVHSAKRAGAKIASQAPVHLQDSRTDREILSDVAQRLGVASLSDWYGVSARKAIQAGARFVEKKHGSSLPKALAAAFPEHEWHAWKFERAPRGLFTT